LGYVPLIGVLGGMLVLLQSVLLNPILLAYAGFATVKKAKGSVVDGAISGAIAGFVMFALLAVIGIVVAIAGLGLNLSVGNLLGGLVGTFLVGVSTIADIVLIVFMTVVGFILGAVGAFLAKNSK
jgi:hypothetical protein